LHHGLTDVGRSVRPSGESIPPLRKTLSMARIVIEPEPTDAVLFMHNPASFAARRIILEYAYRTTRTRVASWIDSNLETLDKAGYRPAPGSAR
jgi:hypothetical protein